MEREDSQPNPVAPEWREYNEAYSRISPAERIKGLQEGTWPEGTPQTFIDLHIKSTAEERLRWAIFDAPTASDIQQVLQRSPEDLAKIQEEVEERARQRTAGLESRINRTLDTLTRTEREVLAERFGLRDGRSHTQKEVGQQIGRSPRSVGRIERSALFKLRHPDQ